MTRRVWAGFAALCLLAGSGWAVEQSEPGILGGLLRIAVHNGLLALAFGLASRGEKVQVEWEKIAAGAVAMFVLPEILFAAAAWHVSGPTGVLVFLLVPVVVIFTVAQRAAGFGAERNPLEMMVPALVALGGAALLIPFTMQGTAIGRLWIAALVGSAVVAGVAAVWMHEWLAGVSLLRGAAIVCAASCVAAAAFCEVGLQAVQWNAGAAATELARCALLDAPILLLTIWLLREMKPVSFSARLLCIPLVTIVESIAVMRPTLTWTIVAGVLLLAGGAAALLRVDSKEVL